MSKKKGIFLIIVVLLIGYFIIVIIPGLIILDGFFNLNDVKLDKESTLKFIKKIEENGKIFELDDCKGYSKKINGISVRMNEKESNNEYGTYYKLVLKKQGIKEDDFKKFSSYLDKSKLRSFYRIKEYTVFNIDGLLDNSWRYLYTKNKVIDNKYFYVGNYSIKIVKDLGDDWYQIMIYN